MLIEEHNPSPHAPYSYEIISNAKHSHVHVQQSDEVHALPLQGFLFSASSANAPCLVKGGHERVAYLYDRLDRRRFDVMTRVPV